MVVYAEGKVFQSSRSLLDQQFGEGEGLKVHLSGIFQTVR